MNQAWTNQNGDKVTPLQIANKQGQHQIAKVIQTKIDKRQKPSYVKDGIFGEKDNSPNKGGTEMSVLNRQGRKLKQD